MKIRGLFAGLVAALALSACNGAAPTAPEGRTAPAALETRTLPPAPMDTAEVAPMGGGTMGNGG